MEGFALFENLQAGLFAEVSEFQALGVESFLGELFFLDAVFVGEDAMDVLEEGGADFGTATSWRAPLLDEVEAGGIDVGGASGEEVAEVIEGRRGVFGEKELVSEVKLGSVAVEHGGGEANAEVHEELLLDFSEGLVAEKIVCTRVGRA